MKQMLEIRDACEADLSVLLEIYNEAVTNTAAIFNETVVDLENRKQWLAARQSKGFPVLVALRDGRVAGYASYSEWRAFDGYRHTVENSVYVHPACKGAGIGRQLLKALIARASASNLHRMVAFVESGNIVSIHLHESLGFRKAGQFSEVGRKFGRWLDVTCLERALEQG